MSENANSILRSLTTEKLIKRTAIQEPYTGYLKLGPYLLELLKIVDGEQEIEKVKAVPQSPALESWLDTPINELWEPLRDKYTRSKARNALLRQGLQCARDVLSIGANGILKIPQLGSIAIQEIQDALSRNDFGLTLPDNSSPEIIAGFCPDLSRVTASALHSTYDSSLRIIGDHLKPSYSILAVLQTSPDQRASFLGFTAGGPYNRDPSSHRDFVCNAPEVFAYRFWGALGELASHTELLNVDI